MRSCQTLCCDELTRFCKLAVEASQDGHMGINVFLGPRPVYIHSCLASRHQQNVFHVSCSFLFHAAFWRVHRVVGAAFRFSTCSGQIFCTKSWPSDVDWKPLAPT